MASPALLFGLIILLQTIYHIKSTLFNCNESNQCIDQIFTCNPDEDCYIECISENSCNRATFICPTNAYNCNVNCDGINNNNTRIIAGCSQTTFDASHTNDATLSIKGGNKAGNILCPFNGNCYIQCSQFEGCQGMTVNAINSNLLEIKAINGGESVLKDANITCPSNYHKNENIYTCSINVIAQSLNDQHQIENMVIYSTNSFNNLDISCTNDQIDSDDHMNKLENTCFDLNGNPKLYCTESFNDHCKIRYNSNENEWECTLSSNVCNYDINSTTASLFTDDDDDDDDDWSWSDFGEIDIMFRIGIIIILFVCLIVLLSAICFLKQRKRKLKFQKDAINEIVLRRRETKLRDNPSLDSIEELEENYNTNEHRINGIQHKHPDNNKLSISQNVSPKSISCEVIISEISGNLEMTPSLSPAIIYESEADNRCSPNLPNLITMQTSNISSHSINSHFANMASIESVDIEELYEPQIPTVGNLHSNDREGEKEDELIDE